LFRSHHADPRARPFVRSAHGAPTGPQESATRRPGPGRRSQRAIIAWSRPGRTFSHFQPLPPLLFQQEHFAGTIPPPGLRGGESEGHTQLLFSGLLRAAPARIAEFVPASSRSRPGSALCRRYPDHHSRREYRNRGAPPGPLSKEGVTVATSKPDNGILNWQRSISVFIPAFNEEKNLEPTVARLIEALTVTVEDYEIIIVDDGSSDGTGTVADALAAKNSAIRALHNSRNMGLGYCFVQGYGEARKNSFVYIPGDNTWPYRSFVELFGNLGRADIVTSYAINPDVRPLGRRIVSRLYTAALNVLFRHRMQYFNGLTIYPVEFLRRNPATTFGFGFQAEVLLKAMNSGLSYIEVGLPIDARTAGGSKAVTLTNVASVLLTVVRMFFDLRILRHWQPEALLPNVVVARGMMSIDELGFDPDVQSSSSRWPDPGLGAQSVVIAGASSGIGAALAKDLSSAGYQVIACSRNLDRLRAAFADHPDVQYTVCDVSD